MPKFPRDKRFCHRQKDFVRNFLAAPQYVPSNKFLAVPSNQLGTAAGKAI